MTTKPTSERHEFVDSIYSNGSEKLCAHRSMNIDGSWPAICAETRSAPIHDVPKPAAPKRGFPHACECGDSGCTGFHPGRLRSEPSVSQGSAEVAALVDALRIAGAPAEFDEPYNLQFYRELMRNAATALAASNAERERLLELVRVARPVVERMRSMLIGDSCGCDEYHVCGRPQAEREIAAYDAALAAAPATGREGE